MTGGQLRFEVIRLLQKSPPIFVIFSQTHDLFRNVGRWGCSSRGGSLDLVDALRSTKAGIGRSVIAVSATGRGGNDLRLKHILVNPIKDRFAFVDLNALDGMDAVGDKGIGANIDYVVGKLDFKFGRVMIERAILKSKAVLVP